MKRPLMVILFVAALLIAAGAKTERSTLTRLAPDACVEACQKDNRDRVKECGIYYPPASQPVKYRECLDKAKTKFDACLATCR